MASDATISSFVNKKKTFRFVNLTAITGNMTIIIILTNWPAAEHLMLDLT